MASVARGMLVGLLVCLGPLLTPGTGRAAAQQRIGCPAWGYTMTIPARWFVLHPCSNEGSAIILHSMLGMSVQLHTWWSDARSHASIDADMHYNQTPVLPIAWSTPTINGTRYVLGRGVVRPANGIRPYYQIELETFTHHHLYQIMGFVNPPDSGPIDAASIRVLDAAIATTIITGVPDDKPTPWKLG